MLFLITEMAMFSIHKWCTEIIVFCFVLTLFHFLYNSEFPTLNLAHLIKHSATLFAVNGHCFSMFCQCCSKLSDDVPRLPSRMSKIEVFGFELP